MTFTSLPNWQESLDSRLVQRLNRPLMRSGMLDNQMAQAIIDRSAPLHNRLPLLDQQMQRWAKVVDLETPPLAIVYAQLPPPESQPGLPPGTSSISSPEKSPHVTHQLPSPQPLVKAQWVTTSPSLDQADMPTLSNPRSPAAIASDEKPNHRAEIPTQPVQAIPVLDDSDPITEHPIPVTHPLPVVRQSALTPAPSTAMAIVKVGAKQVVSTLESPQLLNESIQPSIYLPLKSDSSQFAPSQPSLTQTNLSLSNSSQSNHLKNNLTQANSSQSNQPQINSLQTSSLRTKQSQINLPQINPPQINLSYFSSSQIQPPSQTPSPKAGGGEIVQRAFLDLDQALRAKVAEATTLEQASIDTLQLNPVQHHETTRIQYPASALEKPSFSQQVESMVGQGSSPYGIGVAVRGIHAGDGFHLLTQPIQNLDLIKPIDLTYPMSTQIPAIQDLSVGRNSVFNNKQIIDGYPSHLFARYNSDSDTIHLNTHVVVKPVAPLPAEIAVHEISVSPLSISPAAFPIQRKIDPRDSSSSVSLQSSGVKDQPLILHRLTDHVPDLVSIREQSTIPNNTSSNNPIFSQIQRKVDHDPYIASESIPETALTFISNLQAGDDRYRVKPLAKAGYQSKLKSSSVTPAIQLAIITNPPFPTVQYITQQTESQKQSIAKMPVKKTFLNQENSSILATTSTHRTSRSKSSVASELDIPAQPRSQPRGFVSPKSSAKRSHRTPQPFRPEAPVDQRSRSTAAIAAVDHTSRRNTQPQRTVAHPLSQRQTTPISKFANQDYPARSPISARLNAAPNPTMPSQPRSQVQTYVQADFASLTQVLAPLNQLAAHQDVGHLHTVIPTLRFPVVMPIGSPSSLAITPSYQLPIQRKVDHGAIVISPPEVGSVVRPTNEVAEQSSRTNNSSPIHAPIINPIAVDGWQVILHSVVPVDRSSEVPSLVFQSPLIPTQQSAQLTAIAPTESPLHRQISREMAVRQDSQYSSQAVNHSIQNGMHRGQSPPISPSYQLANHRIQRKIDTNYSTAISAQTSSIQALSKTSNSPTQISSLQPISDHLVSDSAISISDKNLSLLPNFLSSFVYLKSTPLTVYSSEQPQNLTTSIVSGERINQRRSPTDEASSIQKISSGSAIFTTINPTAIFSTPEPQSVSIQDKNSHSDHSLLILKPRDEQPIQISHQPIIQPSIFPLPFILAAHFPSLKQSPTYTSSLSSSAQVSPSRLTPNRVTETAISPTQPPQIQPQNQSIIQRKIDHAAIAVSHPEVGSMIPPRSRVTEQAPRRHHSSPIHAPISHSITTDGLLGISQNILQLDRNAVAPALVFQSPLALLQQPTQLTAIAPNEPQFHEQISRDIKSNTKWWHGRESHTENRFHTSNQPTQILPFIHQSLNLNVENPSLARFSSQHFSHSINDEMNTRQFHKSAPSSQLSNHQIQRKIDTSQFNAIAVQSQPAYSIKQTSTHINDAQVSTFDVQPISHQSIRNQLIHSINDQSVFSSPLPYINHNPWQVNSTPTQDTHSLTSGITSGLDRDQTVKASRHNSLIVRGSWNPTVQHTGIQSSGLTTVNAAVNTRITAPQSVHSHDSQTKSLQFSQVGQQREANGDRSRDRRPHVNIGVTHETRLPLDLPLINTNNFIEQPTDQSAQLQTQKWDSTHQLITPLATKLHEQSEDLPFISAIAHDPLLNLLELKLLELTRVKLHQSESSPLSQWTDHQSVFPTIYPTREQWSNSFGHFAPLPQANSRHLDGQREMRDRVAPQLDPLPAPPISKLTDPPSLPIVSVEAEPLTIFEPLVLPSKSTHSANINHPTRQPSVTPSQPSFSNPSLTDSSLTSHTASPSYPSFTTNSPHIQPVQLQPQTAIAAASSAPPIDLDALVAQVERRLMKRFVVESERRGKKKWH